jgi:hypothetical protein
MIQNLWSLHTSCKANPLVQSSQSLHQGISDCQSTFVGKKRAFEDAAGNAISFPAASDSDWSLCLFVKLLADLRSLLLAGKSLEYHFAILCFLSRITHFLKFFSAGQSIEPNHLWLLLSFGDQVSSVDLQGRLGMSASGGYLD